MCYTSERITELGEGQVFVFGGNEGGKHGAGAARYAFEKFGAVYGQGFGFQGRSFSIPTKNWKIETLPLSIIGFYVDRFVAFAECRSDLVFFVTKLGMGLAGLRADEIAPLFAAASKLPNVILPREFWEVLSKKPGNHTILPNHG
jgi:hypothetical protein